MPNVKSAKKRVRTNEKRRIRNREAIGMMRTAVKRANAAIAAGDVETAREARQRALSLINKTARKGIIHPNKAARLESRMVRKINAMEASAQ